MEPLIGIIGQSSTPEEMYNFTKNLGQALAEEGYSIINGGLGGVMQAVCDGFRSVKNRKGRSICITPFEDPQMSNPYCDYVIPSGLGIARNLLIVRSAKILIALGGGAGTLSELAFAWQLGKPVLCVKKFGGWAEKMANTQVDSRYGDKDLFYGVDSIEEILAILKEYFI